MNSDALAIFVEYLASIVTDANLLPFSVDPVGRSDTFASTEFCLSSVNHASAKKRQ